MNVCSAIERLKVVKFVNFVLGIFFIILKSEKYFHSCIESTSATFKFLVSFRCPILPVFDLPLYHLFLLFIYIISSPKLKNKRVEQALRWEAGVGTGGRRKVGKKEYQGEYLANNVYTCT
jgi:hypothetical protein